MNTNTNTTLPKPKIKSKLKMVVIGNNGVGKTSIIQSLCGRHIQQLPHSDTVEIEMCTIETEHVEVELDVYDINDTKEYDLTLYMKGFHILLLIVDLSEMNCLDDVDELFNRYKLFKLFEEENDIHQVKYLVGNKSFASKFINTNILAYYAELYQLEYIDFTSLIHFPSSLISLIHQYYNISS